MITPLFYVPVVLVALFLTACENMTTSVSLTLGDSEGRTVGAEIKLEKTARKDAKEPEEDIMP